MVTCQWKGENVTYRVIQWATGARSGVGFGFAPLAPGR
jgi:hypothetical protein